MSEGTNVASGAIPHRGKVVELVGAPCDQPLRPVVVVHRIDGHHDPHGPGARQQLDQRCELVRRNAGDEVGE
jgi:hypothetical protein